MKYNPLIVEIPRLCTTFPSSVIASFIFSQEKSVLKPVAHMILLTSRVDVSSKVTLFCSQPVTLFFMITSLFLIAFFNSIRIWDPPSVEAIFLLAKYGLPLKYLICQTTKRCFFFLRSKVSILNSCYKLNMFAFV